MVLNPQRDWNDSSGGSAVPFDDQPGNGTIDANDIWIEITGGTTGTETWEVCLVDAVNARICRPLGPPTTTSQTRLLTGFGAAVLPIARVEVVDTASLVRQTLDITAIEAALGTATGLNDESLTWSIYGSPTLLFQQFVRRPATINWFYPF
jgi:hypothetical protein